MSYEPNVFTPNCLEQISKEAPESSIIVPETLLCFVKLILLNDYRSSMQVNQEKYCYHNEKKKCNLQC